MSRHTRTRSYAGCAVVVIALLGGAIALTFTTELFAKTAPAFWPRVTGIGLMVASLALVALASREWRESLGFYLLAILALYHGVSEILYAAFGRGLDYRMAAGTTEYESGYATLIAGTAAIVFAVGYVGFRQLSQSMSTGTSGTDPEDFLGLLDGRVLAGWFLLTAVYHAGLDNLVSKIPVVGYTFKAVCLYLWVPLLTLLILKLLHTFQRSQITRRQFLLRAALILLFGVILTTDRSPMLSACLASFFLAHKWNFFEFRWSSTLAGVAALLFAFATVASLRAIVTRNALQEATPLSKVRKIAAGVSQLGSQQTAQRQTSRTISYDLGYRLDANAYLGRLYDVRSHSAAGINFEPLLVGAIVVIPSALWPGKLDLSGRYRNIRANIDAWLILPNVDFNVTPVCMFYAVGGWWFLLFIFFIFGAGFSYLDNAARQPSNLALFALTVCVAHAIGSGVAQPWFHAVRNTLILLAVMGGLKFAAKHLTLER